MNCFNENDRKWGHGAVIGFLTLGLVLSFALAASADSDGGWKTTSWIGYEGQGDSDLDEGGDFEYWMIETGLKSSTKMGDSTIVSLGGDYRAVGYDFGGLGGNLWDTVHVTRLNPMLTYLLNERWSLTGGAVFQISAESGAKIGDSLTGGGSAAVGYKWSDTGSIVLGVLVASEIEDDALIQPFVLLNFAITDNIGFTMDATSSRGGAFHLTYAPADKWKLGVGGGFRRERFRLDNNGPVKKGVGEEEATELNAFVAYQFTDSFQIKAYGGSTIDGDLRIETKTGKKITDSDYDNAGFGGVRISLAF
jgi:hypothetical protein